MASDAVTTILRLVKQEESCSANKDEQISQASHDDVRTLATWRPIVVEWIYNVTSHLHANAEIVYITMNILDRFINVQSSLSHSTLNSDSPNQSSRLCYCQNNKAYEVAVMTSFLMAMKLEGYNSLEINHLVKMSRNTVTSRQIAETGKKIARSLTWNSQIPTPARFAHAFVQLLPPSLASNEAKESILKTCIGILNSSLYHSFSSSKPTSLLAWMALEIAIENTNFITNTDDEAMSAFRSQLSDLIKHSYDMPLRRMLQDISTKYSFQDGHSSVRSTVRTDQSGPTTIPHHMEVDLHPEDQHDAHETQNSYIPTARFLTHTNVVSLDHIPSILQNLSPVRSMHDPNHDSKPQDETQNTTTTNNKREHQEDFANQFVKPLSRSKRCRFF